MTPAGRWLEESLLTEGGRQALAEILRAGREEERKRGRDPRDLHIIHPFCDRLDYAMEN